MPVDLVQHLDLRNILCAQIGDHLVDLLAILLPLFIINVNDVQQQVRLLDFLQGCMKGLDQIMRNVFDKTDRVTQHGIAQAG